jgi:hypothetical protein
MSSSYPNFLLPVTSVFFGCCLLSVEAAHAADTYVQPSAEVRVESNDNIDLDPAGISDSNVQGYIADLDALIGIATPRSNTSIRPRVRLQEYPDREEFQEVEAFFDFLTTYRWERADFRLLARYSRQDDYNAELPDGGTDPIDPNEPNNPDSGTFVIGETRTRYSVAPELAFDLTERLRAGVQSQYQAVRFDSDDLDNKVDYDFIEGAGFVRWALDERSALLASIYANLYEATDDSTETEAYGGTFGYEYQWSETTGLALEILYEQNTTTDFDPPFEFEEESSGMGGQLTAFRKGEVSEWRFSVGRQFIPTGASGKAESDQIRVQYQRDLTERLAFTGTGRYESRNAITTAGASNNRDYARADVALRWMFSSTWFVNGGYSYIWQDREDAIDSADNNRFFIGVGFKALDRQQR